MPANTAAAPDVSGANQQPNANQGNGTAPAPEKQGAGSREQQPPHSEAIGDRLPGAELYDHLELPEEIRQMVQEDRGKRTEDRGRRTETAPAAAPPAQQQQAQSAASNVEDEHPLTEAERRNTDPALLARIAKLTAQREELRRLVAKGSEQGAGSTEATTAAPSKGGQGAIPAATTLPPAVQSLQTAEELNDRAQTARSVLRWAKLHREGAEGVVTGRNADGTEIVRDYTPQEVAQMEVNAEDELQQHLPTRAREIAAAQQSEATRQQVEAQRPFWNEQLQQDYPELETEKDGPLAKAVDVILQNFPFLADMPDGRLTAADVASKALERAGRLQGNNGNTNGNGAQAPAPKVDPAIAAFLTPKPPRAPAVPSTGHGAPATPASDAAAVQARDRYIETGAQEDYERWMDLSNSKGRPSPALA